jgi:outer membrane protein assembly factor BamB
MDLLCVLTYENPNGDFLEMSDEHNEPKEDETADVEESGMTAEAADTPAENVSAPTKERPKPDLSVVFPVLVIVAQLGLIYYFLTTSTTPFRTLAGMGIPILASTVLVAGWWVLFSLRIPWRERFVGLLLAGAAIGVPLVTAWPADPFFLFYILPSVTTSVVIVAALTRGMDWGKRRKGLAVALGICLVMLCLVRVSGVNGTMAPLLAWRWSGEGSIASQDNKVATLPEKAAAGDWPGFRGAEREGRNLTDTFDIDWEAHPPKELWRQPVGLGWSSFTVIGDYFFTQEQRGDLETVVCYEVATGEQVWLNSVTARFKDRLGDGPRATPTFVDGKLYTQGATGFLQCIDGATGNTLWQTNIREDAGTKKPMWGYCSSPLVTDGLVITYSASGGGKSVLAYGQEDGKLVWSGGKGDHGYSSPHLGEIALTPQVLVSSNYGMEAFDPKTGTPLWDQEWRIGGNPRVTQPYVMDLYSVIGGTGQGKGARLIKADKDATSGAWTVQTRWESKRFRPYFNDFVYYNGFCYGFDGDRIGCMDTTDGKVRWSGKKIGGQILLLAEMEMLLVLTEKGEVLLIPAFPSGGEPVARLQALSSKTWNHPVISGGKLFVRNDKEAVCYALPPATVVETATEAH